VEYHQGSLLGLSLTEIRVLDLAAKKGVLARFSYDRATRLLDVGLDFCCERSVAVEAGGAVATPEDRTPAGG
jgi:hypothetical protein